MYIGFHEYPVYGYYTLHPFLTVGRNKLLKIFTLLQTRPSPPSYMPSFDLSFLAPSLFFCSQTNERTSEIYFMSSRQPPFRVTRKSVPWFVRGEKRSSNPLQPSYLPSPSSLKIPT